jgi:hypothetical protein
LANFAIAEAPLKLVLMEDPGLEHDFGAYWARAAAYNARTAEI